jgi:hypothetical protein
VNRQRIFTGFDQNRLAGSFEKLRYGFAHH